MTKQQRERLEFLKREATSAKRRLIEILSEVESLSPTSARKLGAAIGRVEAWQVSGPVPLR